MKKIILVLMLLIFIVSFTFATEVERRPALKQFTMQEFEKTTGKKITQYNEAPMLKKMVERGELPPVEERLPSSPVVLQTLDKIGQYGGTWRRVQVDEIHWVWNLANFESLAIFDIYQENLVPELAKEWMFNNDYTELTLKLHEGIKWSDGVPFTVDDIIFWWEEVVLGKDDYGSDSPWAWLALPWTMRGGKPMRLQKIDNYTIRFFFAAPNPTAPLWWQTGPHYIYIWPTHWVKQYHGSLLISPPIYSLPLFEFP
ncbi:Periplasmic alpha-galactoside-binding protein [subsurface metagenome]